MLYSTKRVVSLLPEVAGLVKAAQLEQDFPTDTRDSTLLSALEVNYLTKLAGQTIDLEDYDRVHRAVGLYGLRAEVGEYFEKMAEAYNFEKQASASIESELQVAVEIVESQCSGLMNLEKVAAQSEALWDEFGDVNSDLIRLYAGGGRLCKEAAISALKIRQQATGLTAFEKLAETISGMDPEKLTVEENRAIIGAVQHFEKQAGYNGNFYRDAFHFTKEAIDRSLTVNLGSKKVPAIELHKMDSARVTAALGEDIAKLLSEDLMTLKAGVEALPNPEKELLAKLC